MRLFTSLILIFLFFNCYAQKLTKVQQLNLANDLVFKKHQPADLVKDVQFVYQKLRENHPNLYWYISKRKLDKKFDSLNHSFDLPLSSMQFRAKLMSVLCCIGDGHMQIFRDLSPLDSIQGDKKNEIYNNLTNPLPFTLKLLGSKLYISSNNSDNNKLFVGSEVLSIDNHSSFEIIKRLENGYINSDGYNKSFKTEFINIAKSVFDEAYCTNYLVKDSLKVTSIFNGVEETNVILTQGISKDTSNYIRNNFIDQSLIEYNGPSGNLAKLTVGQFAKNDNDFYKKFFTEIKNSKISCLIIDLRNNPGGDVQRVKQLFSFLVPAPTPFLMKNGNGYVTKHFKDFLAKNQITESRFKADFESVKPIDSLQFKGKLYILINGGSFSGASILPSILKGNKNITLVGSETGGSANGCTAYIYDNLILPTTKLSLRYGLIAIKNPKQVKLKGRGVMPDVEINYTIAEYLAKRDLEMDWVLNDIKKNK